MPDWRKANLPRTNLAEPQNSTASPDTHIPKPRKAQGTSNPNWHSTRFDDESSGMAVPLSKSELDFAIQAPIRIRVESSGFERVRFRGLGFWVLGCAGQGAQQRSLLVGGRLFHHASARSPSVRQSLERCRGPVMQEPLQETLGPYSSYGWLSKLWSLFGYPKYYCRCRIILRTQKVTVILTTTHLDHHVLGL